MLQPGSSGCRRAHDRLEIDGCAGPVIGLIDLTDAGRGLGFPGWSIGDTNALLDRSIRFVAVADNGVLFITYGHRSWAIAANESTASSFSGQGTAAGSCAGRSWI